VSCSSTVVLLVRSRRPLAHLVQRVAPVRAVAAGARAARKGAVAHRSHQGARRAHQDRRQIVSAVQDAVGEVRSSTRTHTHAHTYTHARDRSSPILSTHIMAPMHTRRCDWNLAAAGSSCPARATASTHAESGRCRCRAVCKRARASDLSLPMQSPLDSASACHLALSLSTPRLRNLWQLTARFPLHFARPCAPVLCCHCSVTPWTTRNGGCNHIKCGNCSAHWCWVCQKDWV